MSEAALYRALAAPLMAVTPRWATKAPGVPFTPAAAPWQRWTVLKGQPETIAFGDGAYTRTPCILQIDLFYPKSENRVDLLLDRADLVKAAYWPRHHRGLALEYGSQLVEIRDDPKIGTPDEGASPSHLMLSIEVAFSLDAAPA